MKNSFNSMKIQFFIFISIFTLKVFSHNCVHGLKKLNQTQFIDAYKGDDDKRFLQAGWTPIRIYVDYTTLLAQTSFEPEILPAIKKVIDQTVRMFQNIIKVKRLKSKLVFSSCGDSIVPDSISNIGVDADMVIFPIFDSTIQESVEAYASSCVQDLRTGKPVAGLIAFTRNFNFTKANWLEYNTYLAFHELTHIFVFSDNLWKYFKDSYGNPIPIENIIADSIVNGLPRKKIITPLVVSTARKHYNCPTLDGVELENQGGEGTKNSHWESRTMLTDYMIGRSYDDSVISEITLAFFEDSGWYKVNFYTGGLFRFGKNMGCDFLNSKCIINQKSQFPSQFCDDTKIPTCSNSRFTKGFCLIANYKNPLNSNYVYFSSPNVGGFEFADYCPVPISIQGKDSYLSLNCVYGVTNNYPLELEENVSSKSACFISTLVNKNYLTIMSSFVDVNKAICYAYSCNDIKKVVSISVGNSTAECPTNGGVTTINNYAGVLYCPDYNSICTKDKQCISMTDCALKMVNPLKDTDSYSYSINYTVPTGKGYIIYNADGGMTSGIVSGEGVNFTDYNQYWNNNNSHCIFIKHTYVVFFMIYYILYFV